MSDLLIAYLVLAAWFSIIDLLAGRIARSPSRKVASIFLALLWPLSNAFAILASAAIIGRHRDIIFSSGADEP